MQSPRRPDVFVISISEFPVELREEGLMAWHICRLNLQSPYTQSFCVNCLRLLSLVADYVY